MNNKAEYTPEKVVDISNLSREDWLEYRKKGIGGSDVAAIMGISPFATIRDLFYNKTGVQPVIQEEEESNWVAKEVGHRLEDLVAEIFSKKTGLEVFPVRVMFRHPLYPFMLADVDFFVRMPDGTFAILECKTCNYNAKDKWADEGIPAHYVLQVRHYLSVMNMQKAFIACLYGNNENEFVYRTIERDLIEEEDIIDQETYFWQEHVLKNVVPPHNGNPIWFWQISVIMVVLQTNLFRKLCFPVWNQKILRSILPFRRKSHSWKNGKRKSKQNSEQSVFLLWNSWGRAARQCWRTVRTVTVLPIIRPDVLRLGKTRWRS